MLRSNSNQMFWGKLSYDDMQKLTAAPNLHRTNNQQNDSHVSQGKPCLWFCSLLPIFCFNTRKTKCMFSIFWPPPKKIGTLDFKVALVDPIFLPEISPGTRRCFSSFNPMLMVWAKDSALKVASDALCKADMCCWRWHGHVLVWKKPYEDATVVNC